MKVLIIEKENYLACHHGFLLAGYSIANAAIRNSFVRTHQVRMGIEARIQLNGVQELVQDIRLRHWKKLEFKRTQVGIQLA